MERSSEGSAAPLDKWMSNTWFDTPLPFSWESTLFTFVRLLSAVVLCLLHIENTVLSFILMLWQDYFVNMCSDTHVSQKIQFCLLCHRSSSVTPEGVTCKVDFHMWHLQVSRVRGEFLHVTPSGVTGEDPWHLYVSLVLTCDMGYCTIYDFTLWYIGQVFLP